MWKTSIDERLSKWHGFRLSLNSLPLDQALKHTAELWADAPYRAYYLDPMDHSKWPDPWELITQRQFCELARCLGIIYTIYFTEHNKTITPEIRLYQDVAACRLYSIVWVNDGEYILNLTSGEVVNIKQIEESQLQFLQSYSTSQLSLEKY